MWTRPMDHQAKTLKGSRERAVRGHGKKLADRRRGRKLTRAMENRAKPRTWHTPRRRTLTRSRERAVRGHGKKLADGRRGRKLTRAMENWAKPRTWHTPRTRTRTRTRERVRESGKKWPIHHANRLKTS